MESNPEKSAKIVPPVYINPANIIYRIFQILAAGPISEREMCERHQLNKRQVRNAIGRLRKLGIDIWRNEDNRYVVDITPQMKKPVDDAELLAVLRIPGLIDRLDYMVVQAIAQNPQLREKLK